MQDSSSEVNVKFNIKEKTKGVASGKVLQLQLGDVPTTFFDYAQLSASKVMCLQQTKCDYILKWEHVPLYLFNTHHILLSIVL